MKKNQLERRAYRAPQVSVYQLKEESALLHTSFNGQHKPGTGGGTVGDAKRNDFFDDEDWDEEEGNDEP